MPDASTRDVTSALRTHFHPVLKSHAFQTIKPRYALRRVPGCNWIVTIKCVGAYFSTVTGFPSLSLCATVGVNYPCVPNPWSDQAPTGKDGSPQGMQVHLDLSGNASLQPRRGLNHAEAARGDVWWVEPDGSNLDLAVRDLTASFKAQGVPWFEAWGSLECALQTSLQEERDYPGRTWRIYALAKELGNSYLLQTYRGTLEMQWPKHCGKLI